MHPNSDTHSVAPLGKHLTNVVSPVHNHEEFVATVRRQLHIFQSHSKDEIQTRVKQAYYLLGWMVGDLTKHFSPTNASKMRLSLELTTKHPENLSLGEYVAECLRALGIPCKRIKDSPIRKRNPNSKFRWLSVWSSFITWMYQSCLGLLWNERTSHDAVRMQWLLSSPPEFRLWFTRGLADSDGSVNFRNNNVSIITSPNTELVKQLLESLRVHVVVGLSKGCGVVTITTSDAAKINIFNPDVLTHRRKALAKLIGSRKFPRKWPDSLSSRVHRLMLAGMSPAKIARTVFEENNIYIKINTVTKHMKAL